MQEHHSPTWNGFIILYHKLAASISGRGFEQKRSFAPSTSGAKADFVCPSLGKHGSYQHGLARAVWEPNSLWQFIVLVVNVHICGGLPALTASVFRILNSLIVSSFTSLFRSNFVSKMVFSSCYPFYTSFLYCFPFKNIPPFFFLHMKKVDGKPQ